MIINKKRFKKIHKKTRFSQMITNKNKCIQTLDRWVDRGTGQ